MPTVAHEGAELYYEVHGSGPPLVLAHGAGGNTLVWWQQVPFFAERWRVVVFDHRGFGRSRCPDELMQPRHFVGDLAAIMDAAGVPRAALVCQSMGGFTGVPFAVARPERVSALVLCGTPGGIVTPSFLEDVRAIAARMPATSVVEAALSPAFRRRHPALEHLYAQISVLGTGTATQTMVPRLGTVRVDDEALAGLRVPTLVIAGTDDWFFRPETLREVAARIPGAAFRLIEGAGHSTYFEVPDEFNRIVEAFLLAAGADRPT